MKQQKKSKPTAHRYITAIVAVLIAVACYGIWLSGHDPNQKPDISAQSCAVDPVLLYNPCRPWIGSSSGSYPQASGDLISQLTFLNKRVNDPTVLTYPTKSISLTHKIDVAHIYQSPGNNLFSSEALKLINSTDYQYVMVNWKPMPSNSYHWADVNANNATEKAYVQAAANAVAALPAGKKIFLAPFHEPENDVSVNNCATNASGASMGSPTDYVNMWHYIHSVFDQTKDAGGQSASSHVLWVINFMGFSKWNCLIPQLWPGNNYVDWVAWDPYGSGPSDFDNSVGSLYKYMSQNSGGDHDYLSKKWALNEFGYGSGASTNFNDAGALQYWKDALKSINAGTWSLIKMYNVFDTHANNAHSMTGLTVDGSSNDVTKQTAYNAFANAIFAMGDSGTPAADTTNPTVSLTAPANGATVAGIISVTANASDNVGVTEVKLYVDGAIIKDDTAVSDGWTSLWNTAEVSNGTHTLKAVAYDAAGNTATATEAIAVNNPTPTPVTLPPAITSFSATPSTVTVGTSTVLGWVATNTASCSVTPGGPTNTTATAWQTPSFTATGTTTYTLTCKDSAGTAVSATTSVTVKAPTTAPSNVVISASSTRIVTGGNVTLSWTSVGSTSCTLHPGKYLVPGTSGSKTMIGVTKMTTYWVTCTNSAGNTQSNKVTVMVSTSATTQPAPTIDSFTATPTTVTSGQTSVIAWQATNVVSGGCNLTPSPLTSTTAGGQWTTPALTSSASYTLTCRNSAGVTASKSVSVKVGTTSVPPAPTAVTSSDPITSSIITLASGTQVTNTQVTGSVTQGSLATLDTTTLVQSATIVKVEYYSNGQLIQTVTQVPFALDTTNLKTGDYSITQRIYFSDGSTAEKSQVITIKAKATSAVIHNTTVWIIIAGGAVLGAAFFLVRHLLGNRMRAAYSASNASNIPVAEPPKDEQSDFDLREHRF